MEGIRTGLRDRMNYTMEGIITCITCMFAVALAVGGPIRRQASQSEKTVSTGGNVILLCPFVPDDTWVWVYWKKNNQTFYSLEVKSNTPSTNDTRYESSNNATRLAINDLQKTDSGIYSCKVATLATTDFIKEGGQVLISVTDEEVGLSTTSPGVSFRDSTTIPPQPAEDNSIFSAFLVLLSIPIIFMFFCYKYRKGDIKDSPAEFVSGFGLGRDRPNVCHLCNNYIEVEILITLLHITYCRSCLEKNGLLHDLGRNAMVNVSREKEWDYQQSILKSMDLRAKCRRSLLEDCNDPYANELFQKLGEVLHVTGDNGPEPYAGSSPPSLQDSYQPTNGGGTKASSGYNTCAVETDGLMMSVTSL